MLQVQDYYVIMKLNRLTRSKQCLIRLMVAGIMMNKIKVPHRGTPHFYPTIQMTHLCVLAYWESIGHVARDMMRTNMACVSEDLGELSFSMLARCVLGDHIKSDILHMDELYKLLPVYRDLKQEIGDDTKNKDAMGWHHTIQPNAVEVSAVAFFFDRMIGEVFSNTFRSYTGEPAGYKSRNAAAGLTTDEYLAPVYIDNYDDLKIHDILKSIPTRLEGYFLQGHQHIWPSREEASAVNANDREDSVLGVEEDDDVAQDPPDEKNDNQDQDRGFVCADWSECMVNRFAVVHFKYGAGETYHAGIQVYKIHKLDPPVGDEVQEYYNTFQGKQLLCTQSSTTTRCVHGKWHLHPNRARELEKVHGYSVIHYFDRLESNNFTPATQETLLVQHSRLALFEDNRIE